MARTQEDRLVRYVNQPGGCYGVPRAAELVAQLRSLSDADAAVTLERWLVEAYDDGAEDAY